jgi:hypothetical protein
MIDDGPQAISGKRRRAAQQRACEFFQERVSRPQFSAEIVAVGRRPQFVEFLNANEDGGNDFGLIVRLVFE